MRKLYIIRHAKSSWKESGVGDFERPLNKRGSINAPFMGNVLKHKNVMPDMILASPALRTKTTAEILAYTIDFHKDIVFNEEIYEANDVILHKILTNIPNEVATLFLVGHNPGLQMLAEHYVDFADDIPTTGILEIEFACGKWNEISSQNARLLSFEYPKKYKEE
ncbi:MAG: histidine phosphatase family protein [Sulfurimonas sp.]|nr:histidine phosphatase family protein [Sulfurimonas sp.]